MKAGDWKYLKLLWRSQPFPYYVARGGQAEVGQQHNERANLRELYRNQWGDPSGVQLREVALFAIPTRPGSSITHFSMIKAEAGESM